MRPTKSKRPKSFPKSFWAVDTEDCSDGDIALYTIFDGEKFSTVKGFLKSKESFEKFIKRHADEKKIIFAHNMLYDIINLIGVDDFLNRFEIFFTKSKFIFAKYGNLQFRDTTLLFPMSLKKLGSKIGLEKIETADFMDVEYNKRDTEIVWTAVKRYVEFLKNNDFDFGITNGAIALKIFQRHYLEKPIIFNSKLIPFCKRAYYGGRAENFVKGQVRNINVYDVNSLYPYVMYINEYPDVTHYTRQIGGKADSMGIYRIRVNVSKTAKIPLIPYRDKSGRLLFPCGNFETFCTGNEILAADANDQLNDYEILDGIRFENGGSIFSKFVKDLYAMRLEEKDGFLNQVIKNIMNSLYGKFGQGNERYVYNRETKEFELVETDYQNNSIFPFAAMITANARIYTWRIMNDVLKRGGKLYYSDTDSIHTNIKLPCNNELLGALKFEGHFSSGEYQAAKQYFLVDKSTEKEYIRCKGVPDKFAKEFFLNGHVTYQKPNKLLESLKRGLKCNKWEKTEKRFHNSSDKRQFYGRMDSNPLYIEE